MNCDQIIVYDTECCNKDTIIATLEARVRELESTGAPVGDVTVHSAEVPAASSATSVGSEPSLSSIGVATSRVGPGQRPVGRRGKAPPVDPFSAENPEVRLDDWFPTLDRATVWNGWSDEEALMQLAGHLRGKALREWNLLNKEQKTTYKDAITALRLRIDPQNRVIAATDFRHALQAE